MILSADVLTLSGIALLTVLQKIAASSLVPAVKTTVIVMGGLLSAGFVTQAGELFEGLFAAAFLNILGNFPSSKTPASILPISVISAFLILKQGAVWETGVGLVTASLLLFKQNSTQTCLPTHTPDKSPFATFTLSILSDAALLFGLLLQAPTPAWAALRGVLLLGGIFLKWVLCSLLDSTASLSFLKNSVLPVITLDLLFRTVPQLDFPHGSSLLAGWAAMGLVVCPLLAILKKGLPQVLDLIFQGITAFILLAFSAGAVETAKVATIALLFLRTGAAMLAALVARVMSGETDIETMGGLARITPKTGLLFVLTGIFTVLFVLYNTLAFKATFPEGQRIFLVLCFLSGAYISAIFTYLFERIFWGESRTNEFVMAYMKEPPLAALVATLGALSGAGLSIWSHLAKEPSIDLLFFTLSCGVGLLGGKWIGYLKVLKHCVPFSLKTCHSSKVYAPQLPKRIVTPSVIRYCSQFFFEKFYSGKASSFLLTAFLLVSGTLYFIVLKLALM